MRQTSAGLPHYVKVTSYMKQSKEISGESPRTIPVRHSVDGLTAYLTDKPENSPDAIRLCFNENLFGPSPEVIKAISAAAAQIHLYPDPNGWELKEILSQKHHIPPEQIILGNGADSLITLLSTTFLNPNEEVLFCEPTFPIYRSAARIALGIPKGIPLDPSQRFDLQGLLHAITPRTKIIYLCNPNNPSGTILPPDEIASFLRAVPNQVLVVLDEAYVDFTEDKMRPPTLTWIREGAPLISLRTFSKAYGLAGIRIGYAMASRSIIDALYRVREPFSVSSLAIKAAVAALKDTSHYKRVIQSIVDERTRLQLSLSNRGLHFIPSQANFIFVDFHRDSQAICHHLSQHGILIRCSASWKMPTWARITIGPNSLNTTLLSSLDKILKDM